MSRSAVIFTWCLAIIALGVWSYFAISTIDESIELDAATKWPTAQGVVVSAAAGAYRNSKGKTYYKPQIQYRYQSPADGAELTAKRLHARRPGSVGRSEAERLTSQFAVGTPVTVRVDPADPRNALLEPGMRSRDWVSIGFLAVTLLVGLALLSMAWHFTRRRGPGYVAGVRIREGSTTRARPESCGALSGGLFTGSLVSSLVCAVGFSLFNYDLTWVAVTFASGLFVGVVIWIWVSRSAEKPSSADLSLDYEKELVTTPSLTGFKPEIISMPTVTGTAINAVSSFNGKTKTTLYQVHLSDAERTFGPVAAVFSSEANAKTFEAWLRQQLALSDV